MSTRICKSIVAALVVVACAKANLHAQTTAFTYQGFLRENGAPANGTYDLQARLWPNAEGGFLPLGTVLLADVGVTNGLFTANLDFGTVFDGADRWLEIAVRAGTSMGSYTLLAPRQAMTSAPYAIRALEATSVPLGTITSNMLADGSVTSSKLAEGAVNHLGTPDGADTSVVTVDDNGLVGVGTDTPAAGLHITSGASILTPIVRFQVQDSISGSYTNLGGVTDVAASGNLLAVASIFDNTVMLLDVTNPDAPIIRSQLNSQGGVFNNLSGAHGLAFSGNVLAVASWFGDSVTLIDLSNPASPGLLSVLQDGVGGFNDLKSAYHVALAGNLMAVTAFDDNAVTLVDVSNPANPILRAVLKDGVNGFNDLASPRHLLLSGNLLVVGARDDDAVTFVDVSNPASPVLIGVLKDGVGGFDQLDGANAVALSGNLLAIAAVTDDAVTLADISNPANPVLLATIKDEEGGYTGLDGAIRLAFSGDLLAIAGNLDHAVTLVDVGDPTTPRLKSVFRDGVADVNYLRTTEGLTFVNGNLAVAGFSDSGLTLVQPTPAEVSLVSEAWIGIGTQVPLAPLHVVGDMIVEGATLVALRANHVALGMDTLANGNNSTAMGNSTKAYGSASTAMGSYSTASGHYSTAMGIGSEASGFISTAMGDSSKAIGDYSFALGRNAQANHEGAFVQADSQLGTFASERNNQFRIRAGGGARFDVNSGEWVEIRAKGNILNPPEKLIDTSTGAYLSRGGTWVNSSDRAKKENLQAVDARRILDQIVAMPLSSWNYKVEDAAVRHLGPMAQDFYSAFDLGGNDTSIATVDADGVALAAIQGLNQKLTDELKRRDAENAELKQTVNELKQLVGSLADKLNGGAK